MKLCRQSYWALLLSQFIAQIGDTLYFMAVAQYILKHVYWEQETILKKQSLFMIVGLAMFLGTSFLAPIIYKRLHLYQALTRARSVQVGVFGLLLMLEYLNRGSELPASGVFLCLAACAFCEGVLSATRNAYWPHLLSPDALARSNKLIFGLLAPISLCVGYFSSSLFWDKDSGSWQWRLLLVLILFLWVISLLISLKIKLRPSVKVKRSSFSVSMLSAAWRFVYRHPLYKRLFMIEALEMVAMGIWAAPVLNFFVKNKLQCDDKWLPYLNGFYKVGGVIGGVLVLLLILKRFSSVRILAIDSLLRAILILFFILLPYVEISLILAILMGVAHSLRLSVQHTLIQTNTTLERIPQVYSVHKLIWVASFHVGGLLMASIISRWHIEWVYIVAAGLLFWSAIVSFRIKEYTDIDQN